MDKKEAEFFFLARGRRRMLHTAYSHHHVFGISEADFGPASFRAILANIATTFLGNDVDHLAANGHRAGCKSHYTDRV